MMNAHFPPGPQGTALLGSTRELVHDRLSFLEQVALTYGDIAHFRIGRALHVYLLNNPDYIQQVLVGQADKFEKAPGFKQNSRALIGEGILTSEGEFHRRQRKLVQPAFHHGRVASYAVTMVDYAETSMSHWQTDHVYDIHHEMMELTRNIVAKTLFNADVSNKGDAIADAITVGLQTINERSAGGIHFPDWLPTRRNRKRHESIQTLDNMLTEIIEEHRTQGDQGDLMSMLLMSVDDEDGGQMTNRQARDEAMTLFIAGHETTANALAWTWYLLAQHPEVEAKLLHELETALAGRKPTFKDLAELPYTDMIIKEAMRLYPPAWMLNVREAMEDVTIGGYSIAKGSYIMMMPYAMHHNPRYYHDPEAFIPERWTPEFEKSLPRYAYYPFGGGARVCIGQSFAMMEARLVLATIAQSWHMALVPNQHIVAEPVVTLRPRGGIKMLLTRRSITPLPATIDRAAVSSDKIAV